MEQYSKVILKIIWDMDLEGTIFFFYFIHNSFEFKFPIDIIFKADHNIFTYFLKINMLNYTFRLTDKDGNREEGFWKNDKRVGKFEYFLDGKDKVDRYNYFKDVKEVKDAKEVKEVIEVKEVKEVKEIKEVI